MKEELIDKIVTASGVTKGELILIHYWGEDAEISIMHQFAKAVIKLGATPLQLQQARSQNIQFFSHADEHTFGDKYFSIFEQVDAIIDIFLYQPVILGEEIEVEKMKVYGSYMKRLFQSLMSKQRFTQIRIPTKENALDSNLPVEEYIENMERAYDIDYSVLKEKCHQLTTEYKKYHKLSIQTGEDCEITFDFTGREWLSDCGDGDWPCGEIYIAPVEDKTNGTIFYNQLYIEEVGCFEQVKLTIRNGQIMSATNPEVDAFFHHLSDEDKVICELGFGLNENVTKLCGYTVLDEKMNGTFHIAIGCNTMFGGENNSGIHMDMVFEGEYKVMKEEK